MDKNKEDQIRNTFDELVGEGNLKVVEETFAEDYVAHASGKNFRGHSFIKQFVSQLRTSIPDIHIDEVRFLASDDNTIVWQRTLSGTHQEEMKGIPPSKKKVKWTEMVVTRFSNEKIVEDWVVSELMGELLLRVPNKKGEQH